MVWDKYRRIAAQYRVVRWGTLRVPSAFLFGDRGALLRRVADAGGLEAELTRGLGPWGGRDRRDLVVHRRRG